MRELLRGVKSERGWVFLCLCEGCGGMVRVFHYCGVGVCQCTQSAK